MAQKLLKEQDNSNGSRKKAGDKVRKFFAEKVSPTFKKLEQKKYLIVLKNAYMVITPLSITGAMGVLFTWLVFGYGSDVKFSLMGQLAGSLDGTTASFSSLRHDIIHWQYIDGSTWQEVQKWGHLLSLMLTRGTIGFIGIYLAALIGYRFGEESNFKSPITVAAISLASFFICIGVRPSRFGAMGLITAMFAGLLSSELFLRLHSNDRIVIKAPKNVPDAVARSLNALIPTLFTLLLVASLNFISALPFYFFVDRNPDNFYYVGEVIIQIIITPFMTFSKSGGDVALLFVYVLGVPFLHFFGIHGSNTLNSIFKPILFLLLIDNFAGANHVFTGAVTHSFLFIGGDGDTLATILLILFIFPKGSPSKVISKVGIIPGIFGLNATFIYGLPIMLNFKLFIPFVTTTAFMAIPVVIFMKSGWVNTPIIPLPWITPKILYGFISTKFDWRSIILTFITFGVALGVWAPFVLLYRKDEMKKIKEGEAKIVYSSKEKKKMKMS